MGNLGVLEGGMRAPIYDGASERLSQYLTALGQHLWDSRQRASFAMYVLGLLHFFAASPWPDDVRRTAVRFALADLTR